MHAAAKLAKRSLDSLKLVSDIISSEDAPPENLCERVRAKNELWSARLFEGYELWLEQQETVNAYETNVAHVDGSPIDAASQLHQKLNSEYPGQFLLSAYQKSELRKNLRALEISWDWEPKLLGHKISELAGVQEIAAIKGPAKKRGGILTRRIKELLMQGGGDHVS
jgi:hypothetical protein